MSFVGKARFLHDPACLLIGHHIVTVMTSTAVDCPGFLFGCQNDIAGFS